MAAGSNAIDRVDFGNPTSEAAHNFGAGHPETAKGVGALGQTFRAPLNEAQNYTPVAGSDQELAFTMTVSPTKQNYITVRMWGSDTECPGVQFKGYTHDDSGLVNQGGGVPYPNRFYYCTESIPLAMTQGKTSVQLILYEVGFGGQPGRPIYSAYTHTDPCFVPDSNDPTGSPVAQVGQLSTTAPLTKAQVCTRLQNNRQGIYGAGQYYDYMLSRQIMPGTAGAPPETIGADLGFPVANAGTMTDDMWRDYCGGAKRGPGYSTVADEYMTVLISTYLLPPFKDVNDNVVPGLDHYRDPNIIQRLVLLLDSTSYMQASDGHYQPLPYAVWGGVTSTPRAAGHPFAGYKGRGEGWSITLEGVDVECIGRAISLLLDDPVGGPLFRNYLAQSIDGDLNGGSMTRARVYQRMLNNSLTYFNGIYGFGTVSQGLFMTNGLYASRVALSKLDALFPYSGSTSNFPDNVPTNNYTYNFPYPAVPAAASKDYVLQAVGADPATPLMNGIYSPNYTNYPMSPVGGFGEAHGARSGGYDGRYGTILPWNANMLTSAAMHDPNVTSAMLTKIRGQARQAAEGYLRFVYPNENYYGVTNNFTLAQEDFITYRDNYATNANRYGFNVGVGYAAADPALGINSPLERRGAYLEMVYNIAPGGGKGGGNQLNYFADLSSYEAVLRGLIGVDPATLTKLPGEPAAPGGGNSAFIDPYTGTAAIYYNGERLLMNNNYRNAEYSGFQDQGLSYVSRIHHTTSTIDRAVVSGIMPHDSATVQSDGNLCGGFAKYWVMRYGNWLVAGNPTSSAVTVTLPAGSGVARDVVTDTRYNMGSSVNLPAMGTLAINMPIAVSSQPIGNGSYVLTNASSKLLLNCPGGAATPGLQITQAALPASGNSQWVFTANGSGYYTVKNVASGLYLTGPASQGNALVQQPANGQTNQNWQLIPLGGGYMLSNQANNLVVNNPGGSNNPGTGMIVWPQDAGGNSSWVIEPAGIGIQPIANGTYTVNNTGAYQLLTNPGSSTTSGQVLNGSAPTGGADQKWIFTANGSGYYTIKNAASGLFLTPADRAADFYYPQLLQKTGDGSDLQLWAIYAQGRGYGFVNKSTTDMMGINGSLLMDRAHGHDGFCWAIQPSISQASPVITSPSSATGATGIPFSYQIAASNSPTNFSATGLPPGLTVNTTTGTIGGLPTTGGNYTATVRASNANGTGSATVSIAVTTRLYGAYDAQDIGSVGIAGSASYQNGVYTLNGSGADIWGTADGFQYAAQTVSGDCTIITRVASQSANSPNKSGVMIRESLAANAQFVDVVIHRTAAVKMEYRSPAGGSAAGAGNANGIAAPYWVKLVRAGNVFTGSMSPDGITWTQVGQTTVSMASNVYVGLVQTSHDNGVLSTGTFDNVSLVSVPSPWLSADIGSPALLGSAVYKTGVFTVTASGGDIWNSSDQFRYVYQNSTGDCSIVARVVSQSDNSNAKSGVMIRETTAANSIYVDMNVQRTSGTKMEYRSSTGGGANYAGGTGGGAPYWVKLTRVGNVFTGYTSPDGITWTQASQVTISMAANALIGLPQCASDNNQLNTATFDNVTAVP